MNVEMGRRDFLIWLGRVGVLAVTGDLLLAACAPAPTTIQAPATARAITPNNSPAVAPGKPTPFADNKPIPMETPRPEGIKPLGWVAVLEKLTPALSGPFRALDQLITDPLIKNRIVEVVVQNYLSVKDGALAISNFLKSQGKVIGTLLCGDSRVICNTINYTSIGRVATEEIRTLGGAPIGIFEKGTDVSIASVHVECTGKTSGCGALGAFKTLGEAGGRKYLQDHLIDDATINEIFTHINTSNPDEQAIIAAKIQAMVNAKAHKTGHVAVAAKIGVADNTMKPLGAFNEKGESVIIPELAKDFIAIHNSPADEIDALLAAGQEPFEAAMIATRKNAADLMGPKAARPGFTFKISSTGESLGKAINMAEVERMAAGIGYPNAHKWGRLLWIFAETPEEMALLREKLMKSNSIWRFLGRNEGVIAEVLIDAVGKMRGNMRITRLASIPEDANNLALVRKIGTLSAEVKLSTRTVAEAQRMLQEAEAAEAVGAKGASELVIKLKSVLEGLKGYGKIAINLFKWMIPIGNAQAVISITDMYQNATNMKVTIDRHSMDPSTGSSLGVSNVITDMEWKSRDAQSPKVEPYLLKAGGIDTVYTHEELEKRYWDLTQLYKWDYDNLPKSPDGLSPGDKSQFSGMRYGESYNLLNFDFRDPNEKVEPLKHKVLIPLYGPIIVRPLGIKTSFSPIHRDISPDGLKKQPFEIINTATGEMLITGVGGEMIVPVIAEKPGAGKEKTVYYMYLYMDEKGNLRVRNVGYDDSGKALSMKQKTVASLAAVAKKNQVYSAQNDAKEIIPDRIQGNDGVNLGLNTTAGLWRRDVDELNQYAQKSGEVKVNGAGPQTIFQT